MTLGFEVFVQEVIAAMTTSPSPRVVAVPSPSPTVTGNRRWAASALLP